MKKKTKKSNVKSNVKQSNTDALKKSLGGPAEVGERMADKLAKMAGFE